ncbi:MAG: hypothetical protein FWF92_08210 [Oscillospiraceae bacterium]|nr:hypothetical protein [Oscillospiraceae bacterium]
MKKIKIIKIIIICVIILSGCSDTRPSMIAAETVDLAEERLNGQWDVWLEVRQPGDGGDIYETHLRFNVSRNSPDGDYSFSIYRKEEDKSLIEKFSGLSGFLPEYTYNYGFISVEGSDVIHIWFEDYPEYPFIIYLSKNEDGKIIGTGAVMQNEEDETITALEMVLIRKW